MTTPYDSGHFGELLPAYLNGSLGDDEHLQVERHLDSCDECRMQLSEWQVVSEASQVAQTAVLPPSDRVLQNVHARLEPDSELADQTSGSPVPPAVSFGAGHLWQVLIGQIPMVRHGIWMAVPATFAVGCLVALVIASPQQSGMVLALVAPVVAAVSMALIYGPENDPSLELALSTATSPRAVLLARMTLVFGYDLSLALAATAIIAVAIGGTGLWPLIVLWIAPMLFLSAFALAASLIFSTTTAITGALVLWFLRVFALTNDQLARGPSSEVAGMINTFWETSPFLLSLFACIVLVTVIAIPGRERFA